jgi:voltage-gated potassium channel
MDESPSSPRTDALEADLSADESQPASYLVDEDADADADDPTGRLSRYLARTQTSLDILALLTLWIVIVPVADFGDQKGLRDFGLSFRLLLSLTYGVDMAIRTRLAQRHWHYLRTHPLGVLAVVFPPVRVLFSLRLIRQLFQRGNLRRFLIAALFLMLNGALIVWLFERDVPGANILTLGDSIWWSIGTVTTVGYGDFYPITFMGQAVATFIMFIGIVTVAVITAQVASSFVDQSTKRAEATRAAAAAAAAAGSIPPPAPPAAGVEAAGVGAVVAADQPTTATPTLEDLDARMARIEALLTALVPPADGTPPDQPR